MIRFSFAGGSVSRMLGALLCAGVTSSAWSQVVVPGEVHWDQSQNHSVSPYAYGTNVWQGFDPTIAGTPGSATYKSRMGEMRPGIVRYHSWEMLREATEQRGWLNNAASDNPTWNQTKIGNALNGAYAYGPAVMMNIPKWPDSWNQPGTNKLRTDRYIQFANFCADLVRIVNTNLGKGVVYWEVMNEPDLGTNPYNTAADFEEVGRIFAQCATAMKAVDPSIKVGGPGFAAAYNEQRFRVEAFLRTSGSDLAFVSYHGYGTYDKNASTQSVYDAARDIWGQSYWVSVARNNTSRYSVEQFHDELNVNSSINEGNLDTRGTNEKGLIYNTLSLLTLATYGYTKGNMVWNESDGWYGLMDGDTNYTRRPAYYGIKLLTDDGGGEVKTVSGFDNTKVCAFALQSGNYVKLFLVNRAEADVTVKATVVTGLPSYTPDSQTFTRKVAAAWNGGGIYYPGDVSLGTLKSGFVLSADTVTELILDTGTIAQNTGSTLTASASAAPASVNFATEGTFDWVHWGDGSVSSTSHGLNRKSGANKISDFTVLNGSNTDVFAVTNGTSSVSWTGGNPTASATNIVKGVSMYRWWTSGVGFRITVPADTTARTLKLYAGTNNSNGRLTVSLSGGGTTAQTINHSGLGYEKKDACFTVNYKAASAGQTLTVEFVNTDNLGGYSPSETRLFGATVQ